MNENQLEVLSLKLDQLMELIQQPRIEEWLTEEQTQKLLNLKTTALWELRKTGALTYSKIGKRVFYSLKSIKHLIEKNIE
jgi:hypothetical protein